MKVEFANFRLAEDEDVRLYVRAAMFRGETLTAGRAAVTDRRVIFEGDSFVLAGAAQGSAEIPLADVVAVGRWQSGGILPPNGFFIRTRNADRYRFVRWRRKRIVNLLENLTAANPPEGDRQDD